MIQRRAEANPLVVLLAEIAIAVVERRRATAARRAKMTAVEGGKRGGDAA